MRIALDDFGTGYSSLSYLKRFPIDTLKIDRSFVRDLATDADDASIVSAVIGMGKGLQIRVVAEGVETRGATRISAQAGLSRGSRLLFQPTRECPRIHPAPPAQRNEIPRARWTSGAQSSRGCCPAAERQTQPFPDRRTVNSLSHPRADGSPA